MRLPRLPIPVPPAHQETLTSYLARLANLHGLHPRELWEPVSVQQPGGKRCVDPDRLAVVTGRAREHLAWALPELRDPAPDWTALRHQSQPGCPRCDGRHLGGPVTKLLGHHQYVCTRHRYWIGPPDVDQPATALGEDLADIVRAQRRHLHLVRRHGSAAVYDAVLTGFLFCGHAWTDRPGDSPDAQQQWTRRGEHLIPVGNETTAFSASRLFASVYPQAVDLAQLVASPRWRHLASGDADQRRRFTAQIGQQLRQPRYRPADGGDAIAHWMKFDAWQPPSRPEKTFPDTRAHGATQQSKASTQNQARHNRSAHWFRARKEIICTY